MRYKDNLILINILLLIYGKISLIRKVFLLLYPQRFDIHTTVDKD